MGLAELVLDPLQRRQAGCMAGGRSAAPGSILRRTLGHAEQGTGAGEHNGWRHTMADGDGLPGQMEGGRGVGLIAAVSNGHQGIGRAAEMQNRAETMGGKKRAQGLRIAGITHHKLNARTLDGISMARLDTVEDHNRMAPLEQAWNQMGAHISGTTGEQDGAHHNAT